MIYGYWAWFFNRVATIGLIWVPIRVSSHLWQGNVVAMVVLNRATRLGQGLARVGDWIKKKGFCFSWVFSKV
jgi:hypothetical protein